MIPFRSVTHWGPPWSRSIEFLFSSFNCPEYVSSSRNGKQGVQREDVHRILFPCSLFSFFFFLHLFSPQNPFPIQDSSRFSRQTIHSKFVSGFTFPLCEKRQRNLAFCHICSTYTLDQILSANFMLQQIQIGRWIREDRYSFQIDV